MEVQDPLRIAFLHDWFDRCETGMVGPSLQGDNAGEQCLGLLLVDRVQR